LGTRCWIIAICRSISLAFQQISSADCCCANGSSSKKLRETPWRDTFFSLDFIEYLTATATGAKLNP